MIVLYSNQRLPSRFGRIMGTIDKICTGSGKIEPVTIMSALSSSILILSFPTCLDAGEGTLMADTRSVLKHGDSQRLLVFPRGQFAIHIYSLSILQEYHIKIKPIYYPNTQQTARNESDYFDYHNSPRHK